MYKYYLVMQYYVKTSVSGGLAISEAPPRNPRKPYMYVAMPEKETSTNALGITDQATWQQRKGGDAGATWRPDPLYENPSVSIKAEQVLALFQNFRFATCTK